MLRAAWAYWADELSQTEVAERLGLSPASIHNLLRQAREGGLVRVTLDPAVMARTDAARRLAERYGLEAAYLVPDGPGSALDRVARAAAMWLDDLAPRQGVLGVAWGETVHRLATLLPRRSHPGMTVVQLVGSVASPFGVTAETCTSLIAERMGPLASTSTPRPSCPTLRSSQRSCRSRSSSGRSRRPTPATRRSLPWGWRPRTAT